MRARRQNKKNCTDRITTRYTQRPIDHSAGPSLEDLYQLINKLPNPKSIFPLAIFPLPTSAYLTLHPFNGQKKKKIVYTLYPLASPPAKSCHDSLVMSSGIQLQFYSQKTTSFAL